MDESEMKLMLSFGRAYRMLEAWVEADGIESTRRVVVLAFGRTIEFSLAKVLASAQNPLSLSEISARCGASKREVLEPGRLRLALDRMERVGVVINVGTRPRPLYQLNLLNGEAKILASMLSETGPTR